MNISETIQKLHHHTLNGTPCRSTLMLEAGEKTPNTLVLVRPELKIIRLRWTGTGASIRLLDLKWGNEINRQHEIAPEDLTAENHANIENANAGMILEMLRAFTKTKQIPQMSDVDEWIWPKIREARIAGNRPALQRQQEEWGR